MASRNTGWPFQVFETRKRPGVMPFIWRRYLKGLGTAETEKAFPTLDRFCVQWRCEPASAIQDRLDVGVVLKRSGCLHPRNTVARESTEA